MPRHISKSASRFFLCPKILIQNPAHRSPSKNNYIPCNGVASSSCLFNSRDHTFADARACKLMVPKWGQGSHNSDAEN